jgi:hypothetical protein
MIGAGVEHMGRIPFSAGPAIQKDFGEPFTEQLRANHALVGQGEAAERVAEKYEISRQAMDELSERSHRLAAQAGAEGRFDRGTTAVNTAAGSVTRDQGIRPRPRSRASPPCDRCSVRTVGSPRVARRRSRTGPLRSSWRSGSGHCRWGCARGLGSSTRSPSGATRC